MPFSICSVYIAHGEHRGREPQIPTAGRRRSSRSKPNKMVELGLERTAILKIHGAIDREDAERDSWVITEEHYVDYLTRTRHLHLDAGRTLEPPSGEQSRVPRLQPARLEPARDPAPPASGPRRGLEVVGGAARERRARPFGVDQAGPRDPRRRSRRLRRHARGRDREAPATAPAPRGRDERRAAPGSLRGTARVRGRRVGSLLRSRDLDEDRGGQPGRVAADVAVRRERRGQDLAPPGGRRAPAARRPRRTAARGRAARNSCRWCSAPGRGTR